MKNEFLVAQEGGMSRSLLRQYDGGKLNHYTHFREDLDPHMKRVRSLSEDIRPGKSEYEYIGSVPRIMIHKWLIEQGKSWHEYATDKDLKAKFMVWFKTDCQKMLASNYQERVTSVVSGLGPTAPSTGAKILKEYREENKQ